MTYYTDATNFFLQQWLSYGNSGDANAMFSALFINTNQFINGTFTIATLPSANQNYMKYAWVNDLHDSQPDRVISDGTYWKPVRPFATKALANSDASWTLTALINSPTQILRGALTAARSVTVSNTYAYPGAKFRLKREASGTLYTMTIVASANISLSVSNWVDIEYVANTGWVQTASGGLL